MLSNGQLLVTGSDRAARMLPHVFNNTRSTRNSNTETHQFYHNTNLINGTRWGGASGHVGGYRGGPEKRRGKRWHGTATLSAPLEKFLLRSKSLRTLHPLVERCAATCTC
jgi:hypothetical protein